MGNTASQESNNLCNMREAAVNESYVIGTMPMRLCGKPQRCTRLQHKLEGSFTCSEELITVRGALRCAACNVRLAGAKPCTQASSS